MSDITVTFKNETILTMDASGSKPLLTQGKYCEDDITISYVKPAAPSGPAFSLFTATSSATTARAAALLLFPNPAEYKVYFAYITKSKSTWVENQFLGMVMTGVNMVGTAIRWRNGGYNSTGNLGTTYDVVIQPGDTFMICEADFVL